MGINPIFALLELAISDLPSMNNMYSYSNMYYSMTSMTGYITENAYTVYFSSGFMIAASVLLNIFSAVLIKPVKKWQMGK